MSSILFIMLMVAFVDKVSVDGQSTFGPCEANGLNFADEMQSKILDEFRYLRNQVRVYNCSQIEDFLGRQLNNRPITETLQSFSNRLESIDQNVRNGIKFSEDLQLQLENMSRLYEKQVNTLQAIGILLEEHGQYSRNQSAASIYSRQDFRDLATWPGDCADIRKVGQNVSDVYQVSVLGPGLMPVEISVYCDMNSSDAGWLVIQRHKDGSENFERTWIEYKNGFGNLRGEFWLGNNALHLLTSNRNYKLRIELEDFEGDMRYAEYKQFAVGSASDNYRLSVSGYSGNAGDNLAYHNAQMFSTFDADHDNKTDTAAHRCITELGGTIVATNQISTVCTCVATIHRTPTVLNGTPFMASNTL